MVLRQRLKDLRSLAARLERLPESEKRAQLLADVRVRIVEVETGDVTPPRTPPQPPPRPLPPRVLAAPPGKLGYARREDTAKPRPARHIEQAPPRPVETPSAPIPNVDHLDRDLLSAEELAKAGTPRVAGFRRSW